MGEEDKPAPKPKVAEGDLWGADFVSLDFASNAAPKKEVKPAVSLDGTTQALDTREIKPVSTSDKPNYFVNGPQATANTMPLAPQWVAATAVLAGLAVDTVGGWVVPSPKGLVPSPKGLVPSLKGLVPSPKGLVPSLKGLVLSPKGLVLSPKGLVLSP